ncbi:MAG TPA: exodeoxyribonuclease III [Gammaproteobacteria bacterium]|nr:exodeoxyribonuclease III [Gammaproteobacteria bacterium]
MFRIITLNVNGMRAAARKGVFSWLAKQKADVVCLQEIRATQAVLKDPEYWPKGYQCFYVDAKKKGYSGVALYTRHVPDDVITHIDVSYSDEEGRYIHAQFGSLIVSSVYFPSGTSGQERQTIKYQFLDDYYKLLKKEKRAKKSYIICGDLNIAHKEIDLKNWKANQTHSGFLPKERAWLDQIFDKTMFVDAFRVVNTEPDQYTWWSHRGRAWEKNVGWRIDYQVVSPDLKDKILTAQIYKAERFSDHAPLIMDYDFQLSSFGYPSTIAKAI